MPGLYSLPPKKARVCRIAGTIFIVIAALNLIGLAAWIIKGPAPQFSCELEWTCRWTAEPLTLLDEEDRAAVQTTPGAMRTFGDYVSRFDVRATIAAVRLLHLLPFAAMIFAIGMALRVMGRSRHDLLSDAMPWLRRASVAAMVWALGKSVHDSALATVLLPGMPSKDYDIYLSWDINEIGVGLMLAIAAYAAVWALESGLRAQRDLDEFV